MKPFTCVLALGIAAMLGGCGNLEANRRSQALHGLEMTAQMEIELARFRQQEAAAEQYLMHSVLTQKRKAKELEGALRIGDLGRKSVGADKQLQVISRLNDLVHGIGQEERERVRLFDEADHAAATLLAPLPSTAEATATAQQRLAELAAPLPWKVQAREVLALVESVRDNYEANKKKMKADAVPATTTTQ